MKTLFYPGLAASNIRKNARTYLPYTLTCIGTIAMFLIMETLRRSKSVAESFGGPYLTVVLFYGSIVLGVFSFIFLFYTHSFLIKRRKKEFGLYNILGMEKKHISRIMLFETVYVALISLALGVVVGAVLSKLVFLLLRRMLNFAVALTYEFSLPALLVTLVLFGAIFLLSWLNTLRQIHLANPIELISSGRAGEKEPKTKWIMTILGLACLSGAYYISLTTVSPLDAIFLFFLAVLLVIAGTYLLFTAGSIALLKLLRKNKRYYYKTRHFTAVSGMIYRMKQNAVGLSNICILCTAVLVLFSTTVSLYAGMDDLIRNRYPRNIIVDMDNMEAGEVREIDRLVEDTCAGYGVKPKSVLKNRSMVLTVLQQGSSFTGKPGENVYSASAYGNVFFIPVGDYNDMTGKSVSLAPDEVLLCTIHGSVPGDTMTFGSREFTIRQRIDDLDVALSQLAMIVNTYYVIAPDVKTIQDVYREFAEDPAPELDYYYGFDVEADDATQIALSGALRKSVKETGWKGYAEGAAESRDSFYTIYGSLLFIGVFIGLLFIMATVLIIYYKQISEGYDDRERFGIMQKVGMSREEVKQSIHSQVLTVFFLPLIVAAVHVTFAFPIIAKIMALLNLTNTIVFIWGCIITFLIFAILYAVVYALTARAYYRIVSEKAQ